MFRPIAWPLALLTIPLMMAPPAFAQGPYQDVRQGFAESNRAAMGFAYPHDQSWYGSRRLGGSYEDQWPTDLYSRKVEHGAYSSSNGQYGFSMGIGLAAGFADVAAQPVGEGFAAGFNSPWYQMPYYWNSSTAGPVNTYMPNPGTFPWFGYRPPYWNWGGGFMPGPMPYPPMYGGGPWMGGGPPMGGGPWMGGGFPGGGVPGGGWSPQVPQSGPSFW